MGAIVGGKSPGPCNGGKTLLAGSGKVRETVRCLEYDISEFLVSCVDRYKELGGKTAQNLRRVDTPFVEEALGASTETEGGELQPIAARVLMKVLYAARMCRYDLLRATCYLATQITKWNRCCDKALHRLMCYINSSLELKMMSWVGNPPSE